MKRKNINTTETFFFITTATSLFLYAKSIVNVSRSELNLSAEQEQYEATVCDVNKKKTNFTTKVTFAYFQYILRKAVMQITQ